jgi:uncharacterized protein YktA (UPF0223 family)
MNTLQTIYNKLSEEKTELAKHEVNLGTIEEIALAFKQINGVNDNFNKLDAIVQKNFLTLNNAYKQIVSNKDYEKKTISNLDKLQATLIKLSKDLGIDYKQIPAYKQIMDGYRLANQVNDSIVNAMDAVKSLGK